MIPANNRRGTLISFRDGNPYQAKIRLLFRKIHPCLTRDSNSNPLAERHNLYTGGGGEIIEVGVGEKRGDGGHQGWARRVLAQTKTHVRRSIASKPRDLSSPIGPTAVVWAERRQIPIGRRRRINLHMHPWRRALNIRMLVHPWLSAPYFFYSSLPSFRPYVDDPIGHSRQRASLSL
ncbi:uncharacterized protein TNCV_1626731 [Trichonephila clavipes]|nr:uncharacterized protein TNCV_1626731 [Trichonephila clavipes]